jgi:hypothetical protein
LKIYTHGFKSAGIKFNWKYTPRRRRSRLKNKMLSATCRLARSRSLRKGRKRSGGETGGRRERSYERGSQCVALEGRTMKLVHRHAL